MHSRIAVNHAGTMELALCPSEDSRVFNFCQDVTAFLPPMEAVVHRPVLFWKKQ